MKRVLIVVAVAAVVAVGGCRKPTPEAKQKVRTVAVETVVPRAMTSQLTIRAAIEPWQSVHLSAEVTGRLAFIAKEEGQRVGKGERLFGIDKASYEAQLRQAEAAAKYAVVNCERCEKLRESKAISEDEIDKARADRDVALAAVEVAKTELAKTDIFSPIDGVLDAKLAEIGEVVTLGTPLGDLVDVSRVKVIIPVPEKDVVHVRLGETMKVTIDALGSAETRGEVIFVKQVADAETLTFPVHVALDNRQGLIRPGMIARVVLVRQHVPEAVAVPLFAVVRRPDGYHVFVEDGGVARRRDVRLGFPEGDRWQVVEGLKAGDRLIVRGQRDLIDGDAVEVEAAGAARPAAPPAAGDQGGSSASAADGRAEADAP